MDPKTYRRHLIHGEGRAWAETNCYADVLVELLHGMGFEPMAALPFTLRIDFEGDQWTFFKFPHADILELYALDINELNPWRSLVHHVDEQVALGRPVLVELDSYFLPDTRGSAYKLAHVKSTVAVNEIDIEARHMGYFHAQGYYHLDGEDFADIFQLGGLAHERMLPPYIEYVKPVERPVPAGRELVDASLARLEAHLGLLPRRNPFGPFKERFERDLTWLMGEPIETFHQYSFATLRQYGACFELVETYLRWLTSEGEAGLEGPADAFRDISATAKTFQFQLARAMARRRSLSLEPLDRMAGLWQQGVEPLVERYG
ncbi:MAG: DUF1839 family protein [Gemmatimonadales bacterium]